jgi:hypothetical protein
MKEARDFGEVMKTIMEGKGDLRDIYNQKPVPLPPLARPKRILKPSELAKKLFCPAFVQKPYMKEPLEKRRQLGSRPDRQDSSSSAHGKDGVSSCRAREALRRVQWHS